MTTPTRSPDELKTEVEGKVAAVRTALQGTDAAASEDRLRTSCRPVDAQNRRGRLRGGGRGGAPGEEEAPKPEDDTVEGEYREV